MIFRQLILSSIVVGFIAGLALSFFQVVAVTPIILEAETYEVELSAASHSHDALSYNALIDEGGNQQSFQSELIRKSFSQHKPIHQHEQTEWQPEEGVERTLYTFVSNILAGIGFSVILLALMSQFVMRNMVKSNFLNSIVWGVAGFLTFFVAPGIGLPPEIPGIEAATLENRQVWWFLAVLSMGVGLSVFIFAPFIKSKIAGLVIIAIPYLIGAPKLVGPEFVNTEPKVIMALTSLHHQFIWASGLANLLFWIILGIACHCMLARRLLKRVPIHAQVAV